MEDIIMGYVFGVILVILAIYLIFFRICWAITKPIFVFFYEGLINILTMTGMSRNAARALISLIAIILILSLIFN